jgi:hypothetical protein
MIKESWIGFARVKFDGVRYEQGKGNLLGLQSVCVYLCCVYLCVFVCVRFSFSRIVSSN